MPGKSDLTADLATDALVQRLRADAEQFSREFAEIDADAFVQRVLDRLGLVPPSGPPVVTFVIDTVNDGVAIEVNDKQVWWESSFDRLGQWLQGNELLDRVVILKFRVTEDVDGG